MTEESVKDEVSKIIKEARSSDRKWLLEPEAKRICKLYGINVPKYGVARSREEAIEIAKDIGYPLVMKIISPDILHKSDVGGVVVGIKSESELLKSYDEILFNVRSKAGDVPIEGVLIEKMMDPATEVIVGMTRDIQFGPVIMFGLGGIFVEIFKDVSFRIAPLEERDAREMIREIKAYPLLEGVRGREPADINSLVNLILRVSDLSVEYEDIKEIDLNPVFVYKKGLVAVDARIILA